jgi:hypothetical protein
MATTNKSSIKDNVYTKIEGILPKRINIYKQCLSTFITDRHESLFKTAPIDRIYYRDADIDKMFTSVNIDKSIVKDAISNTYYGNQPNFNPRAAKDELTILMLCIIRYFIMKKDTKSIDISSIYLAFSGKFYPSIHYMSFPKVAPQDYIMEYVINSMLNNKFILKSKGNLFAAMLSICQTWIQTYEKRFITFSDGDVVYLIGQLHSRIRSFMINIAKAYYKAYENKDYITYSSDNEDPTGNGGDYHLASSDSFKAEKVIQKTMSFIVASGADYKLCKLASNSTVKTEELKSIIESILMDKNNIVLVRKVISILVYTYFEQSSDKNVMTMNFITYSITPKPNSKDLHTLELKQIIDDWLNTGSVLYRKRKHRLASKNNYNRALLFYLAMCIYQANK